MEGESWSAFVRRAKDTEGTILLLVAGMEAQLKDPAERRKFFEACADLRPRAILASKRSTTVSGARLHGFRFIARTRDLLRLVEGHPAAEEALRAFSPHLWRQQLRSQLQAMGILSLPKIRIWALILVSGLLFLFVLFRLLPSAEITIKPREDTVTHTVNIFLVQTGALLAGAVPDRARTMPLHPIVIRLTKTITFDQISKEFSGTNAQVDMTIVNTTAEPYSFRKGTRLVNQAGMVFRLQESVLLDAKSKTTVPTEADPKDLYGAIIGERGNIPAGRKWEFVGLPQEERALVYAENLLSGSGGTTLSRTVLTKEDLAIARKQLENDLLLTAKQMVDEEKLLWNEQRPDEQLDILYYDELTKIQYGEFSLPMEFIGQPVSSVPVEGSITYTAYGYDTKAVLDLLIAELTAHVRAGKRLLPHSMTYERLVAHVIDYADDLSWIKITVDLSGTEQYILDPLSPTGAQFGKKVREKVAGLPSEDALRIIGNFPEVDGAEISVWPPWSKRLPPIPSHIYVHSIMTD
ncbi:MAG: hypothetical protein PHS73_03085 [Candidatus Peribacteraceae bacterium]|nr:hypothetical protein [Candidatus Peribacteraceae bacterium]